MKKNKITFLILECVFLILTLFFAWKIFDRDVPEKRVAVILPESGDNRWNSLIKGMKQSAKLNNLHMIICNTDEIENAEMEKEIIKEQKRNNIDAFIICPAPGSDTKDMLKKQCAKTPYTLIMEDVYSKEGGVSCCISPFVIQKYFSISVVEILSTEGSFYGGMRQCERSVLVAQNQVQQSDVFTCKSFRGKINDIT